MSTEKLKIVSGAELLDLDLPPLNYTVKGLLPQGFHILAGQPKAGKSWLLLLLCLKVANGEPFWNYETTKGTVLYLCLEDSYNRIQMRLSDLTENAPKNLYFATMSKTLSNGLSKQITQFITEHPDTNLIIIDTLQKVRTTTGSSNYYANDYQDIGAIKDIADTFGISIIAVQHLRKQKNGDPHLMISGSTGLTGAADSSYVLQKQDISSTEGKLFIRGRDIEEKVLTLRFNKETYQWEFISGDSPTDYVLKNDTAMMKLIGYMTVYKSFNGTASELIKALNLDIPGNVISRKLKTFEKELEDLNIYFIRERTGDKRTIRIVKQNIADDFPSDYACENTTKYINDDNDGNDDN